MNKLNMEILVLRGFILAFSILIIVGVAGAVTSYNRTRTERCYNSKAFDKACIVERLENIENKLDELMRNQ